jgi:hypothetical protein
VGVRIPLADWIRLAGSDRRRIAKNYCGVGGLSVAVSVLLAALAAADGSYLGLLFEGNSGPFLYQVLLDFVCSLLIILAWNHSRSSRVIASAMLLPVRLAVTVLASACRYGAYPHLLYLWWTA